MNFVNISERFQALYMKRCILLCDLTRTEITKYVYLTTTKVVRKHRYIMDIGRPVIC
jgi:hypothetical protein